jgi:hypothetical protein
VPLYLGPRRALCPTQPTTAGADRYDYDPTRPVPTRGGAHLVLLPLVAAGPKYQDDIAGRADVIVYRSAPLAFDVVIAGSLRAVLNVGTDAASTDFTARLGDCDPDGRVLGIADGIARLEPADLTSGSSEVSVSMGSTAYRFAAGHRIALLVSSSNYPRFDPNPNTGESAFDCRTPRIAHQEIGYSTVHPSRVELPVVGSEITYMGES